jgi:NADPH2:quinone reductase
MAIQMAKAVGAKVIATASSEEKVSICQKYGADYAFQYTTDDWIGKVKKVTHGRGCDLIFDPVGVIEKSLKIAAWNARLLVVGFAGGKIESIAMNKVLLKQCNLMGVYWGGTATNDHAAASRVWSGIEKLIAAGRLTPVIYQKIFQGLDKVPMALDELQTRKTWGKVVIKIDQNNAKL